MTTAAAPLDAATLRTRYCALLRLTLDGAPAQADAALAAGEALGEAAHGAGHAPEAIFSTHNAVLCTVAAGASALGADALALRANALLTHYLSPYRLAYERLLEEKRALEQLPQVLLEGIPAVVYVAPWAGEPGEILYVGPQSEVVLGYSTLDWITNPLLWLELIDPEDRERALANRLKGQAARSAFTSEYRMRRSDGRLIWVHDEAGIVADDDGQPMYWQGVLFDVTARKAAEQQAALAERERLARDLHDSATQTLYAANMLARSVGRMLKADPAQAAVHVREIESLTQTALAELRVLLLEMHPDELARVPLPALLEQLGASLRSRCSGRLTVVVEPTPPLPADVHVAFYRMAQEALNNAVKHAQAANVQVSLTHAGDGLLLCVSDDGVGFDPAQTPGGRLGLRGLHQRAAAVGAGVTLRSQPGSGVTLTIGWPNGAASTPEGTQPSPEAAQPSPESALLQGEGLP